MYFDVVIIGGGLSSLVCGISLQKAGKECLIISAGGNAMHFSSGTFGLLSRLPDGTVAGNPLESMDKLGDGHPYSKIKSSDRKRYAQEIIPFFSSCGINLHGNPEQNSYRLTASGTMRQAAFAMEDIDLFPTKDSISARKVLAVNLPGYLDFNLDFVSDGLKKMGVGCDTVEIGVPEIDRLRNSQTEMRSVNIAREFEREGVLERFTDKLLSRIKDEERVILPAVFGLRDTKALDALRRSLPVGPLFIATMPPSVPGMRTQMALRTTFEFLGGTFLMGDTVTGGVIKNGKVDHLNTTNLSEATVRAGCYVLSSGNLFGKGIVTTPTSVKEPVFGLDTEYIRERSNWYDKDFLATQPYQSFGVKTDSLFHAMKDGSPVENLFVTGSELAGAAPLAEGSGAGIAIMTAMDVANKIAGV